MAESAGFQNYLRTLIFCIIAKGVSILLLVLLLTSFGARYAYLLLTVELGLVLIIVLSLIAMQRYERTKLANLQAARAAQADLQTCPDYYVKSVNAKGDVVCTGAYTTPDGRYTYQLGGGNAAAATINLSQLAPAGATLDKVCSAVMDPKGAYAANVAWTDLKPRCAA